MNFGAGLPQFGSVSDEKINRCTLTATLLKFSCFNNHEESQFTECATDDEEFKVFFIPKFYANGNCRENNGYVSIFFYGGDILSYVIHFSYIEFSCSIAVVDTEGNKRFLQTLAYVYDPNSPSGLENNVPKFGLGKYIKRDTLLSEPSELLPGDCLTIFMEVNYLVRALSLDFSPCLLQDVFVKDGDKYYFNIDSSFGRELSKICRYFQCLLDTPMMESKTRRVYVPSEEVKAFQYMHLILRSENEIKIETMSDVCQLYVVSDKYDIQPIIEACRQMVKSFFLGSIIDPKVLEHAAEGIPLILDLAETYRDESLKNIVEVYLEIKKKFESSEYDMKEQLEKTLKTEWICEYEKIENSAYFKLSKTKDGEKDPEFKFYK